MKGRNTGVLSVRVEDRVYGAVLAEATRQGITVNMLLDKLLAEELARVGIANPLPIEAIVEEEKSQNLTSEALKTAGLGVRGGKLHLLKATGEGGLPKYDPKVHKPGDLVLVKRGRRWIETEVTEVDGDGQAIPPV